MQKHGTRAPAKLLLVLYRKGRENQARFGFTVSKKVGNAVTRNRVKRMLREAIRHHHRLIDQSMDVVFIASPRSAKSTSTELEQDVISALNFIAAQEL